MEMIGWCCCGLENDVKLIGKWMSMIHTFYKQPAWGHSHEAVILLLKVNNKLFLKKEKKKWTSSIWVHIFAYLCSTLITVIGSEQCRPWRGCCSGTEGCDIQKMLAQWHFSTYFCPKIHLHYRLTRQTSPPLWCEPSDKETVLFFYIQVTFILSSLILWMLTICDSVSYLMVKNCYEGDIIQLIICKKVKKTD